MNPVSPVTIIGAGPAGLTAAYELSKLGLKSILLEKDFQVGGISRTVSYQDYRFDIGGHRFFSKVPYVNQLWQEILKDDLLLRPRMSRIHYGGHFFDYPLKVGNALQGLGPLEALRVMFSYGRANLFPLGEGQEENFEQWVSNRFGHRLYEIFFKTYTEKIWGIPCHEISADWAAQRIKNLSLKQALYHSLIKSRGSNKGEVITSLIEQFHYPRLGPGMMWERCRDLLKKDGNSTVMGQAVTRIRHKEGLVSAIYTKHSQERARNEFSSEQFISSMPLRELILCLDPPPPSQVIQAANNLRYRDYLTVVLVIDRESIFPDNWIYIHTPDVKLGRVQNYKNWSPEMVPDLSRTSLGLEYFLWDADEEWTWGDDRWRELAIRECVQIGLIEASEVLDATVVRMKKAYPVYDHLYRESVATLQSYLSHFKNLQTIGRNGLHRYNNQDHSMLTGVYSARNVAGDHYDVWAVNTEQDYHEDGQEDAKASSGGDRMIPRRIQVAGAGVEETTEELIPNTIFARLDATAMGIAVGSVAGLLFLLITGVGLLSEEAVVEQSLSLLSVVLLGYRFSWGGAVVGALEIGFLGLILGYMGSRLRNSAVARSLSFVRHQAELDENRDFMDKV